MSVVLRVALPVPLPQLFDYLPPPGVDGVRAGTRVLVPFGPGRRVGVVLANAADTGVAAARLKPVLAVLDTEPVKSESLNGFENGSEAKRSPELQPAARSAATEAAATRTAIRYREEERARAIAALTQLVQHQWRSVMTR